MNLSFLRILRILKMSRVLRMFSALRFIKEIRIMVGALSGSFCIFIFCSFLSWMFISVFAIFFVQGMTTYLETESDPDPDLVKAIRADFGSVHCAVLSLFMSVTGGNDWSAYQETVKEIGPHYNYLYLFFIAFFTVAFL